MELKGLLFGLLLVVFLTTGLVVFYSDVATTYNITGVTNLTTTTTMTNMNHLVGNMSATVDTNSSSPNEISMFGLLGVMTTQWFSWLMFFFQLPNVLTSLTTDLVVAAGLFGSFGWVIWWVNLFFYLSVMLAIAAAILKWRM